MVDICSNEAGLGRVQLFFFYVLMRPLFSKDFPQRL